MSLPAPGHYRCKAVVHRGSHGSMGQCPYKRDLGDTEFCRKHRSRLLAGLDVKCVVKQGLK